MMIKIKSLFKSIWHVYKEPAQALVMFAWSICIAYGVGLVDISSESFPRFLGSLLIGLLLWGLIKTHPDLPKNLVGNYKLLEKRDKRGND